MVCHVFGIPNCQVADQRYGSTSALHPSRFSGQGVSLSTSHCVRKQRNGWFVNMGVSWNGEIPKTMGFDTKMVQPGWFSETSICYRNGCLEMVSLKYIYHYISIFSYQSRLWSSSHLLDEKNESFETTNQMVFPPVKLQRFGSPSKTKQAWINPGLDHFVDEKAAEITVAPLPFYVG